MSPKRSEEKMHRNEADAINAHVGMRLRMRRGVLKIDRDDFARVMKVPEADIEAYESGSREITVDLLFRFANLLEVPLAWFHDGYVDASNETCMHLSSVERRTLLNLYFCQLDSEEQQQIITLTQFMAGKRQT